MIGEITDTSPNNGLASGANTETTPVGSRILKLKCELATGFTEPNTCRYLSVQPA